MFFRKKNMSKFAKEFAELINENHDLFIATSGNSIKSKDGKFKITCLGNTKVLSVVYLYINNIKTDTTMTDAYYIEEAGLKWFKNASSSQFIGSENA